jgi:hypothetical protein
MSITGNCKRKGAEVPQFFRCARSYHTIRQIIISTPVIALLGDFIWGVDSRGADTTNSEAPWQPSEQPLIFYFRA